MKTVEELTQELTELNEKFDKVNKELEVSKKVASLNDEEKAYYKSLDDDAKPAFLDKSSDDRKSDVAKSKESDKVVYTDLDGNEYRKSDDPRVVAAVKRADDTARKLEKANDALADKDFEKRAKEELPNLPGDEAVKVEVLKAVDGIEDAETKEKALEMLKAHNAALAEATTTKGSRDQGTADAEEELRKMAQEHYDKSRAADKTFEKSYDEVIKTEKGRKLYQQVVNSTG